MAGEIRLQATAGLTVKALIVSEAGTIWSGSALVAPSTLTDANWTASLVACTEQDTSEAAGTGLYLADWPGALTQAAIYSVQFFSGASPSPGSLSIGHQQDPTEYLELADESITADKIADGALVAAAIDESLANRIADVILRRIAANIESSSYGDAPARGSLYSLIQQLQRSDTTTNAGKLTLFKDDGITELVQLTMASDADAEPTTGVS